MIEKNGKVCVRNKSKKQKWKNVKKRELLDEDKQNWRKIGWTEIRDALTFAQTHGTCITQSDIAAIVAEWNMIKSKEYK